MPRVRQQHQYQRYELLSRIYAERRELFNELPSKVRGEVYRFYRPPIEMNEPEFAAHLAMITKVEPSLTQRAGKHFQVLAARFAEPVTVEPAPEKVKRTTTRTRNRRVSIRAVMRDPIDINKLSRALIAMAQADAAAQMRVAKKPEEE